MDTALQHGVGPAAGPGFVHDALFFSSPGELADATVPFVRDGLTAGDAVVVAASPATSRNHKAYCQCQAGRVRAR